MISLTALENRAIFDAIHAVVGMALDTISYPLGLKWVGEEGIARRQLLSDLIKHLEAKNVSTT